MKRTTRSKKLVIRRETLRLLSDDELQKANGGFLLTTVDWCSTDSEYKCATPRPTVCAVRK
jgi:hypothetical protein